MTPPWRAFQVDGGSESPLTSSTLCGRGQSSGCAAAALTHTQWAVERTQQTLTEECYECYTDEFDRPTLRAAHHRWEYRYNHIRPRQALGYLIPAEFLATTMQSRGPASQMS